MLLDTLRENKFVISLAKKLFKLKKENPFVYKILEVITNAIVLGLWIFASLGTALLMTEKGYTTLDTAIVAVIIIDYNVMMFSRI